MTRLVIPIAELGRRDFCRMAAGCAGLVIAGCVADEGDVIDVGPIVADAPPGSGPDARAIDARAIDATLPPDASSSTCSAAAVDVGLPSAFAADTATLISASSLFVARDAGGLYAESSRCTHQSSATLGASSGGFLCPRHLARYNLNGDHLSGPGTAGLVHYSLCLLGNGHVGVNKAQVVAQSVRLVA